MATVWCMWVSMNQIMFKGNSVDVSHIKMVSWGWLLGRKGCLEAKLLGV